MRWKKKGDENTSAAVFKLRRLVAVLNRRLTVWMVENWLQGIRTRCLELWFKAFWRHLSVESFGICAVVIDHVIVSDPIQLPQLGLSQLLVSSWSPPICRGIRGTLIDALCSSPLASPCSEMVESDCEWCVIPVRLY